MTSLNARLDRARDLLLLLARLWAGLVMASQHGLGKVQDLPGFIVKVGDKGFPLPTVLGPAAALAEFAGGLLLAVGLATRVSAGFLLVTMVCAALVVHRADPFSKKELALTYAVVAMLFVATGPGRWSVDRRLGWD